MIIKCRCNRKVIVIAEYDQMHDIYEMFNNLEIDVVETVQKIDWNSSKVMVISLLISFAVFTCIILVGNDLYEWFSLFAQFAFGVYFLGFKPISRSAGHRFIWFERITGSLMIIASLAVIVFKFFEMS